MKNRTTVERKSERELVVMAVDDCHATYARLRERGVEFIQEPLARYGNIDANFHDPSGNGWKIIEEGA